MSDAIGSICLTVLLIFCLGDPDLLDALIANLQNNEVVQCSP